MKMSVNYEGKIIYGYKVDPADVYALPNAEALLDSNYLHSNDLQFGANYFIVGFEIMSADYENPYPITLRRADLDLPYEKTKAIEDIMVEYFRKDFQAQRPEFYLFVQIT